METVERSVLGEEGMNRWSTGNVAGVGMKLFSRILQWWIHVIAHLSEPIKCTPPRVNHM